MRREVIAYECGSDGRYRWEHRLCGITYIGTDNGYERALAAGRADRRSQIRQLKRDGLWPRCPDCDKPRGDRGWHYDSNARVDVPCDNDVFHGGG